LQAVKTNILGAENVLNVAIEFGVKKAICLSTDKAVYPINAMGISKAMMEKIAIAKSRESNDTNICVTRYGNVMASRGSVIPLFIEQILSGNAITLTDPMMTRFMMTLDDAVDLVLYAFENGGAGDIFVQKAPAATIEVLTKAMLNLMKATKHPVQIIGTRHGEKLFEVLLSREEMAAAHDLGGYYRVPPDLRDLNYGKFVEQGEIQISKAVEYNSHNTNRLDVKQMENLLMKLGFMQSITSGKEVILEE
jgi:UDP-glucose 4-epimerase